MGVFVDTYMERNIISNTPIPMIIHPGVILTLCINNYMYLLVHEYNSTCFNGAYSRTYIIFEHYLHTPCRFPICIFNTTCLLWSIAQDREVTKAAELSASGSVTSLSATHHEAHYVDALYDAAPSSWFLE